MPGSSACDVLLANYVIQTALGAEREVRKIITREVQISVLLKRAIYSNERAWSKGRNGVGCREEEINQVMSVVTLLSRGQFLEAATTRGWPMQAQSHSCLHQSCSVCCCLWQCRCTSIMVNLQVQWHHRADDHSWSQQQRQADRRRHISVIYAK